MAIDIYYPKNGERRELPRLGNNQIPMYIHTTTQFWLAGSNNDFDWAGNDILLDYGGYYDPVISTTHFQIPHEGFYQVSASLVLYPDPAETGDIVILLFNSTHTGFPSGGWSLTAVPLPLVTNYYGTISAVDYFNKGEYMSLNVNASNMAQNFYLDAMVAIAAIV